MQSNRIFTLLSLILSSLIFAESSIAQSTRFDIDKDVLLTHFDCKTDVDDLHTVAAFVTLMSSPDFKEVKYHAVAGTYGVQDGLYVPPNDLFQLAFDKNWTDAHKNFKRAVKKVRKRVSKIINDQGDIWIAEAGQSDFTAALIKSIQSKFPEVDIAQRIHVVQHSNWNEKVTGAENLKFVKRVSDYHKIPDGNAVGNGSPGFKYEKNQSWSMNIPNDRLKSIWKLAIDLGKKYNGKEGRYKNSAITADGLDFSDLAEICWILGLEDIKDTAAFFKMYGV